MFAIGNLLGLIVTDVHLISGEFTYILGPLASLFAVVGATYTLGAALVLMEEGLKDP